MSSPMELGAFSLSLAVKDLATSRAFYEKLGFEVIGGDHKGYEILRNGTTLIGIFQGMFEGNILTFNPGWDVDQNELEPFTDVRQLHERLAEAGVEVLNPTTGNSDAGPASFMVSDPDGNLILVDQHR